ncbi:MAG: CPBP family intramembrane metalloprotease [Oscillospiraceae bacterium]|nr:CPBP family intramembrane metalloprotease [Oscillospiraceae bacterium]
MKTTKRLIYETFCAMLTIIFFFFIQGSIVVIQGMEGAEAKWTQSIFIWASAMIAILFFLVKNKNVSCIGYARPKWNALRSLLFLLPLILVALSGCINGASSSNRSLFFSNLVLTLGIGFAEETYFRGIILKNWYENRSEKKAVIVSALLFGGTHLMNVLGGASLGTTILQIFFALFYGVIMAIIFIRLESIYPCIFLHFLHDFCSWIGNDVDSNMEIVLVTIQTIVLLAYMIYLIRVEAKNHSAKTCVDKMIS